MMRRLLFLIICCFWGLCVFAEEAIPTHTVIKGENGLSVIVDRYYAIYAGESNGYSSKDQYSDSLVVWNNMSIDSRGYPIISIGQTLYLKNPQTFHNGLGNLQEQEQEKEITKINKDVVETSQAIPVSQKAASVQTDESEPTETGDDNGGGDKKSSLSWVWLFSGLLIGLVIGIALFYLIYVKKLKDDYKYLENELNQVKFDLNSEKTSTGSELSRLRSKIQSLEREKQRMLEENVSLGEEIDRLKAVQSHVNENRKEESRETINQAAQQVSGTSSVLYADAIIDDCFVRISEAPNEDTIFVLNLKGENSASISIYQPAYQRIVANPSFLEGCEKQILGNTMQLDVIEGRAQRDASNGKWKIIEKLNVIIK